jgi:hypothetical protein
MTKDQEEFPASELTEEKHRKPYATPELVVHGAVEKLTERTGPGQNFDQYANNRSAP